MAVEANAANIVFKFDQVYLKDASFESPSHPSTIIGSDYGPKFDVQLLVSHSALDHERGAFEVILKATITATSKKQTAFLVEIQQAGAFTISGLSEDQRNKVLGAACPSALFPFLRQQVNHLVTNGGFPPLLLQPVNFEAMYDQKMASSDNGAPNLETSH